ncbi:MAG: hypothetical protein ACMG55_08935 [Microcoleus sp.]
MLEFRNLEAGTWKLGIGAAFSISFEVSAITNYRFPITVTD